MRSFSANWSAKTQSVAWPGIRVERVMVIGAEPYEFKLETDSHYIAIGERGSRADGETLIDGYASSTRRTLGSTIVFIPCGLTVRGWSVPQRRPRWLNIYIDPGADFAAEAAKLGHLDLRPRLHFESPAAWSTAEKLSALMGQDPEHNALYARALCSLLLLEVASRGAPRPMPRPAEVGGLGASRARLVRNYIEENLSKNIQLSTLAALVDLDDGHLLKSFKKSFGVPPHRYILQRRVEQAKALLATPMRVTEIALSTGFADASHFATTFRRVAGLTPSQYRRSLA
jgi:AraC family transcriptional regulator